MAQKGSKQKAQRISSYQPIHVEGVDDDIHDAQTADEDDAYLERYLDEEEAAALAAARQRRQEAFVEDQRRAKQLVADLDKDKLIDLGLYIASGIFMIFTMEQVLQLGMRMGDRAAM